MTPITPEFTAANPRSAVSPLDLLNAAALGEALPLQFWTATPDGALDFVNSRHLAYFGRTFEQMLGWGWKDSIHPDDMPHILERWMHSLASGEPYRVHCRIRRASDGVYYPHLVQAAAMRDETGRIVKWIGTNTEISAGTNAEPDRAAGVLAYAGLSPRNQTASQRLAFLAEASAILSSSIDYETTLRNVAQLAVPAIADWCTIDFLQPDGSIHALAVAHSAPDKVQMAYEFRQRYPMDPSQTYGVPNVIRTGKSELYSNITPEQVKAASRAEEHYRMLLSMGLNSVMVVPLFAAGKTIGSITLISSESGRTFTEDDLLLAESLAHRAALSVENARLFREAQERQKALLEQTAERHWVTLALQESEHRFRELFELAAVGMAQGDPITSRLYRVNRTFCEMMGYTEEELLRLTFAQITHPEDLAGSVGGLRQAVESGAQSFQAEKRYVRKDGSVFWAITDVRIVRDEEGQPLHAFAGVTDITQRKAAEEERERTRRQWEAVVANMTEGLAVFSPEGAVTFMNPAALQMHGFSSLEEIQRHISTYTELFEIRTLDGSLIPLEDWPGPRMLRGEKVRELECKVSRKDNGHNIYASYNGALVQDIDGTLLVGLLSVRDVTEQKVAERAMARLSEHRRLALDSAQMGWWHFDLENEIVHWDERFKAIFGVTAEKLHFEECLVLIHPEDRRQVRDAVVAATRVMDPQPLSIECRTIHKDGSIHWILVKGQVYYEGNEDSRHSVSFVGTVLDITEQRKAEQALREEEARFRQLADAMPQIVWQARPDGYVDYFNQRWYDYTGMARELEGDASWVSVIHPDDLSSTHEAWYHSVQTGASYEVEYRFKRASDGAYRWHLGRALPVRDADGKIVRWFGSSTDIHDQKQLHERNEQLLESERCARSEVERASRMKDEFLATLGHELRTPLNAIMGWATILRDDPTPEDLSDGLEVIERNARAQTRIIEDLLDMSRIISGKVRLDVQPISLPSVVEAAIDTVRPAADAKRIPIRAVFAPEVPLVSGDPNRLQQVFWNLLSNAVKFTPREGRVQVSLKQVQSQLEVSVSDTGEGIKPEFLPYVFDRFRQADASSTRKHGGLGLGLAIVKQLVELHGGTVRVKSEGSGLGTTFTVTLPVTAAHSHTELKDTPDRVAEQARLSSDVEASFPLRGVKVLVVDDEPDARALVTRLLKSREAEIFTAGSASEAFALLQKERPDVLVSDIGMPQEDGYSLIRRIRALGPEHGGNVPAVAVTAYARVEDRVRAISAGFQMHISKPVEGAELLTIVASLAGKVE